MNNLLVGMTFAEWLKTTRNAQGISLVRLAEKMGNICTDAYLSKLENATYKSKKGYAMMPSKEIVFALADALHADKDYVLQLAGYASEHPAIPQEFYVTLADFFNRLDDTELTDEQIQKIKQEFDTALSFITYKFLT